MEKNRAKSIPCPLGGECWSPVCSLSRCAGQLAAEQFENEHKDIIEAWTDLGVSRESVVRQLRVAARLGRLRPYRRG
jgi:hypothetical protein